MVRLESISPLTSKELRGGSQKLKQDSGARNPKAQYERVVETNKKAKKNYSPAKKKVS